VGRLSRGYRRLNFPEGRKSRIIPAAAFVPERPDSTCSWCSRRRTPEGGAPSASQEFARDRIAFFLGREAWIRSPDWQSHTPKCRIRFFPLEHQWIRMAFPLNATRKGVPAVFQRDAVLQAPPGFQPSPRNNCVYVIYSRDYGQVPRVRRVGKDLGEVCRERRTFHDDVLPDHDPLEIFTPFFDYRVLTDPVAFPIVTSTRWSRLADEHLRSDQTSLPDREILVDYGVVPDLQVVPRIPSLFDREFTPHRDCRR